MIKFSSTIQNSLPYNLARLAYENLQAALKPFSERFGPVFPRVFSELEQSQHWSREKLEQHQMELLKKLLAHSVENVPYYQRVFEEKGLKVEDFQSLVDLEKLPILTKDVIRENYDSLTAQNVARGDWIEYHTSGSTGTPLTFLIDKESSAREQAYVTRAWTLGEYKLGDKVVMLRSYVPKKGQPLHRLNKRYNTLYLSAYHLTVEVMHDYLKKINEFGPTLLVGYPSSMYIFACFLRDEKVAPPPSVKMLVTGSEVMLPQYRSTIEAVFNQRVHDWYGCNERVVTAQQCKVGDGYHTNSEYGILEIVDGQGHQMKSGTGRIIGTGLHNYVMPLIRYEIGDMGTINAKSQCSCGRGLPLQLEKIEGRSDEILSIGGLEIPPVNFYTMFFGIPNLIQFQLIQESPTELTVKLVTGKDFSEKDEQAILDGLRERVGPKAKITIKKVSSIERHEKTGKLKCIVNEAKKR